MELKTVQTQAVPVSYFEAGSGAPLVFLHGAGGVTADDPFLAKLAERYHVHAPLLPGYGDSTEAPNIRDMLDITLHTFDVVEALGLRRPLLIGCSLGGMIAAEMAAIAPNDVERLLLIDSAGLWLDAYPVPDLFVLLPHEVPALLFHDVEKGVKILTRGGDIDDPDFLISYLINYARTFGMVGKFLFPIPDRGLKDRLYRIKARTRLIWGASDRMFPLPYAEAFKAAIRNADLVIVPEAGHLPQLEQPAATVRAIADF